MAINSLNSSSHGLSGLMSGMDTQAMVDALLMGTQSKIDKQTARKSVLTMKQEMYHGVMTQLKNLQDSFFSYNSDKTNLLSPSFFNAMSAKTQSAFFKVNATSDAKAGKINVDYIKQLAQARVDKSGAKASGKLEGKVSDADLAKMKDSAKASLTFTVNDGTNDKTVTIDNLNALTAGKGGAAAADAINAEFARQGVTDVKAEFAEGGAIKFSTDDPTHKLTITGNGPGSTLIGGTLTGTGSVSKKMDFDSLNPSLDITVNGVTKKISFDYNATTADQIAKSLQTSLDKAFGKVATVTNDNGTIKFGSTNDSNQISINGSADTLKALGIKARASNKIVVGMSIKDVNFNPPLYGKNQQFNINGVDFNFTSDKSLTAIMDEINNSKAGVKVSYSSTEDKFSMQSTVLGDSAAPVITQTEGNLLSAMFGVKGGTGTRGESLYEQNAVNGANAIDLPADYKSGALMITVNGAAQVIKIPKKEDDTAYTEDEFVAELNKQLGDKFGKTEGGDNNIRFTEAGGKLTLTAERGYNVTIADAETSTLLGIATGSTTTVLASGNSTLGTLGLSGSMDINGTTISLDGGKTVTDLLSEMNTALGGNGRAEFEASTGRFRFFGVDIPMKIVGGSGGEQIFGGTEFNPNNTVTALTETQKGQNAIFSINGVEMERNSNDVNIDGVDITLTGTTEFDASGNPVGTAGSVEIERNTDQVFDGIKKFVEEYNKIVDNLYSLVTEDPVYKKYPPLTKEQKAEMSEGDIKLWEERSKEGLLRSDQALQGILGDMRTAMFKKPAGGNLALYDIGINTYYDGMSSNTGKLKINEDELKAALAKDPEEIRKLFTANDGVSTAMRDVLQDATAYGSRSPNSLVTIAGSVGKFDSSSNIYKEILDIDKNLAKLERTYKTEYDRYWRQFNAMEQVIANMNSQSSWLSQQLG